MGFETPNFLPSRESAEKRLIGVAEKLERSLQDIKSRRFEVNEHEGGGIAGGNSKYRFNELAGFDSAIDNPQGKSETDELDRIGLNILQEYGDGDFHYEPYGQIKFNVSSEGKIFYNFEPYSSGDKLFPDVKDSLDSLLAELNS